MFSNLCRARALSIRSFSTKLTRCNGHSIAAAVASECGKIVDIEFHDGLKYSFHAEWLKDSSPSDIGPDEYRFQPGLVFDLPSLKANAAVPLNGGTEVEVKFKHGSGDPFVERFDARFLHAAAPFVGKVVESSSSSVESKPISGTSMMAGPVRNGWLADGFKIPEFDLAAITENIDTHIEFMESVLFQPGVAFIHGVEAPDDLANDLRVGIPLEEAARKLVGRLNQHTNRATRYSVTHAAADIDGQTKPEPIQKSMDYDCGFKLPMHTDHTQFPGMPGYLQFMQNLQGGVQSYVTDGLAVANYIKEHYPDDYELLTTVEVTHSFRNRLYAASGAYKDISAPDDPEDPVDPYEVCHTHPVFMLASDGSGEIERIAHSETKRGVCAIPFDLYEPFMNAYRRWTNLVEDPMFVHKFDWPENGLVVCNNYRVLHGRADLAPGDERTLIVGYSGKSLTDNRYRHLCQERAKRDFESNPIWTSRLPNQVLSRMLLPNYETPT
eukprot:m.237237 g.237237  ORF g.237237 m.237237 type:complete len:496 (+) comp16055_c1_seq1:475-1962(+)